MTGAGAGLLATFADAGVLAAADLHVARRLSRLGDEPDESVLLAVGLAVRAARAGSVCLDLDRIREVAPDLPWPTPESWSAAVAASPLAQAQVLRLDQGQLYLDRYWSEEQQVVADLARRAAAPVPEVDDAALETALATYFPAGHGSSDDESDDDDESYDDQSDDDRSYDDQRAAAEAVARGWTTVLTGGPGTGKTTTVARLLGVLMSLRASGSAGGSSGGVEAGAQQGRLRVALAAPTGKAAARMVEAVRDATRQHGFPSAHAETIRALEASTLHRLLGWRPDSSTRFRHHRHDRLPHDVVIIDETSMVSLTMMARLLEAVRPSARLVLVGDSDQLASVEAGAVLKDLVEGYGAQPGSPVRTLGRTHRFGAEIGRLATAVREGDPTTVLALLEGGSPRVLWSDAEAVQDLLRGHAVRLHGAAAAGRTAEALQVLDAHRLLCAHRHGPAGVSWWNRTVERLLRDEVGAEWLPEWYAGRPFVVNGNDYGVGLWNGDSGVVCAADGGLVGVVDDGSPRGRVLPTTRLADITTAHAMTVHRSQGSQFDEVTVLLPEPDSLLLTRELFYTAVTRARSVVRVIGSEESVRAAVTRRAQRATGLAGRLRGP